MILEIISMSLQVRPGCRCGLCAVHGIVELCQGRLPGRSCPPLDTLALFTYSWRRERLAYYRQNMRSAPEGWGLGEPWPGTRGLILSGLYAQSFGFHLQHNKTAWALKCCFSLTGHSGFYGFVWIATDLILTHAPPFCSICTSKCYLTLR